MTIEQQSEPTPVNQRVLAEITALEKEAHIEQQADSKANFDTSPIGLWQAAIRDCVPPALSIVPDLAVTDEETEALAVGLAPALAKHFPISEAFALPVEVVAIVTVYVVFNPKIQAIRAKRANEVKEVKADEPAPENA